MLTSDWWSEYCHQATVKTDDHFIQPAILTSQHNNYLENYYVAIIYLIFSKLIEQNIDSQWVYP